MGHDDEDSAIHRKPKVTRDIAPQVGRRPAGFRAVPRGAPRIDSPGYLVGPEAVSVATLTGLQLGSLAYRTGSDVALDPVDLRYAETDKLCLDLSRLEWWDRWRVMWARIGGYHYLQGHNGDGV